MMKLIDTILNIGVAIFSMSLFWNGDLTNGLLCLILLELSIKE